MATRGHREPSPGGAAMRRGLLLAALAGALALPGLGAEKKDNTPPKGFTALFNGKDLDGWQGAIQIDKRLKLQGEELEKAQKAANDKVLPHWKAVDGVLHND